ncbi:guanine nucleotide exchange factor [Anaeramoeba ignava]|uniref:Guanine nucleotide exchange factor n=1 Tax=Anaeramoeba ignava TaxID=1746090 RepID=A0A9Q0R9G0_ANAIG|nr:guanine nucleotide exchange factor [Anaeramoeba ignava]
MIDFSKNSHHQLVEIANKLKQENDRNTRKITLLEDNLKKNETLYSQQRWFYRNKIKEMIEKMSQIEKYKDKYEVISSQKQYSTKKINQLEEKIQKMEENEKKIESEIFSSFKERVNAIVKDRDDLYSQLSKLQNQIEEKDLEIHKNKQLFNDLIEEINEKESLIKEREKNVQEFFQKTKLEEETLQQKYEQIKQELEAEKKDRQNEKEMVKQEDESIRNKIILLIQQRNALNKTNQGIIFFVILQEKAEFEKNELQKQLEKQNQAKFVQKYGELIYENEDLRKDVALLSQEKTTLQIENNKNEKQIKQLKKEIEELKKENQQISKEKKEYYKVYMEQQSKMKWLEMENQEKQQLILDNKSTHNLIKHLQSNLYETRTEKEQYVIEKEDILRQNEELHKMVTFKENQILQMISEKSILEEQVRQLIKKNQDLEIAHLQISKSNLPVNEQPLENKQEISKNLEEKLTDKINKKRIKNHVLQKGLANATEKLTETQKENSRIREESIKLKAEIELLKFEKNQLKYEIEDEKQRGLNQIGKYESTINVLKKLNPVEPNFTSTNNDEMVQILKEFLDTKGGNLDTKILELEDPNQLIFERQEQKISVRYASFDMLIELLINEHNQDPEYLFTFLMVIRKFADQIKALENLFILFKKMTHEELKKMGKQKKTKMEKRNEKKKIQKNNSAQNEVNEEDFPRIEMNENKRDKNEKKEKTDFLFEQKRIVTLIWLWVENYSLDFSKYPKVSEIVFKFLEFIEHNSKHEAILLLSSKIKLRLNNEIKGINVSEERSPVLETKQAPEPFIPRKITLDSGIQAIKPIEAARQITIIEMKMFQKIQIHELCGQAWSSKEREKRAPNVVSMIQKFNDFSFWISHQIIKNNSTKTRASYIKTFIEIGAEFEKLNNFNSLMEIIGALHNASVFRLKKSWDKLSPEDKKTFEKLTAIMGSQNSYKNFREEIQKREKEPLIPYIGVFLTDLTFIEEGNPDQINGLINFSKQIKLSRVISKIQSFQQKSYNLIPVESLQNYFMNAVCPLSEHQLYQLSLENEPRESY